MKKHFRNSSKLCLMVFPIAFFAIFISSCKDDPDPPALDYIGSAACQTCHPTIYDVFMESGHPYKLSKVTGNKQPTIPFRTAAIPTPTGYTWADVSYMIGGYGWKARFVDKKGYIMTELDDTQYNLNDGSQVAYHASDAMGTKKYDCGRCHTTGWVHVDDGGSPQDGLEGMAGQFAQPGIHCEACHGMGSVHAFTEDKADITLDRSSLACGKCHYRNADHTIAASGGFIKHHEQYDELISGGHENLSCNDCHDPHASTINDDIAAGSGIIKTCAECHTEAKYTAKTHNGATCITCHMPKASKSAIKTGDYQGDIKTHIFNINTDENGKLFNAAGDLANVDGLGVSLDYVCYQCHQDASGKGGQNTMKSMSTLSTYAKTFHQ